MDKNKPDKNSKSSTPISPDEKGIFLPGSDEPIMTANLYLKKGLVLLSLLIFPPVGWYIMGQDTRFQKWFEIMFFAYGIISLVIFLPMSFLTLPNLASIYHQLHLEFSFYYFVLMPLLDLLAIACVILGWYLRKKRKVNALPQSLIHLSQLFAVIFYIVLITTLITFGFAIIHVIPKLE